MRYIRPFVEEDIPEVAELHRRVFRTSDEPSCQLQRYYSSYFKEIFLNSPWVDKALPSLVYQEERGKIVGFLGVMPRRMSLQGRSIRAAVASQLIVEPSRGFPLMAKQLVQAFLSGPQDFSLADEANDYARFLWERCGGITSWLYSLYWARPLQLSRFAMSRLRSPRLLAPVAWASTLFCHLVDSIAVQMPQSPFRQSAPQLSHEELNGETLRECISEFTRGRSLRPEYDDDSLKWLLETLAQKKGSGALQKVVVRNANQEIVGWYLYYPRRTGIGEVLQIGARDSSIREVLNHLFYHAWRRDVLALSGRLEPRFMKRLRDQHCFFHHRGYWVLVHSNKPGLLQAIDRGDAFLTRLEGEWCMRFRVDGV